MRPPAHHRAEVGHDGVVQEANRAARHQRPDEQHDEGDDGQFHPMRSKEAGGGLAGHLVDEPAQIPDHADIQHGIADREEPGKRKDAFEGADIVLQERPESAGRGVGFRIGLIRIDEVFEETEHVGEVRRRCSDGVKRCLQATATTGSVGSGEAIRSPVFHAGLLLGSRSGSASRAHCHAPFNRSSRLAVRPEASQRA